MWESKGLGMEIQSPVARAPLGGLNWPVVKTCAKWEFTKLTSSKGNQSPCPSSHPAQDPIDFLRGSVQSRSSRGSHS